MDETAAETNVDSHHLPADTATMHGDVGRFTDLNRSPATDARLQLRLTLSDATGKSKFTFAALLKRLCWGADFSKRNEVASKRDKIYASWRYGTSVWRWSLRQIQRGSEERERKRRERG